ncbi:Rossmann-fold NAD(P)-binding domain-containing protein [Methylobacterium goesingense]|uniref:Uncharacterized protein YbjT (DUF2867 family) n=1 Tax=Methylobacterium goesingense TaxID=243690 RepID=A0ABV2L3J6_9HYPH|nr:epimerase [Methylobacterium goesingense]GJD73152.1 hypothetical protein CFIICLFH_1377 [Methylobacterium goesingense]
MRILLFGATGMVGAGVLRECLLASDVTEVRTVGRTPTGRAHLKQHETVVQDLFDPGPTAWREMTGYDACFFCLGVTSSGLTEAEYLRLTNDLTLAVAGRLALLDPDMTFVYVSGAGTDGGGRGRSMWARVKGRTENALQALPFAGAFMFRPAVILPMHGERSKTTSYRLLYRLTGPVLHLLRRMAPAQLLTTEVIGRAMLAVARRGRGRAVMEASDIYRAATATARSSER